MGFLLKKNLKMFKKKINQKLVKASQYIEFRVKLSFMILCESLGILFRSCSERNRARSELRVVDASLCAVSGRQH